MFFPLILRDLLFAALLLLLWIVFAPPSAGSGWQADFIGTGLGLSIVKGVIEAHRGSVEVESTPGVGTIFKVLLPIVSEGKLADYGKD